jgi:UDP-N-acetylglucosamine 2-epimerase (non-hydrolysing)
LVIRGYVVIRILNVVGARPNFMKVAPLMSAMQNHPGVTPVLVHTGQHYDDNLSRVFFDDLGIPHPDINLGVGSGNREEQIAAIRSAFEPVVEQQRPQAVLVVGDVNSTIACAGVARSRGIAVVHVEAGLRSFDMDMPEEVNRIETDRISDYLFVTEASGMDNLEREQVPGKRYLIGNVMIDTLARNLERADSAGVLRELGLEAGGYAVSTFHRPSNVDSREGLERIITLLAEVGRMIPVVLPLHPRTRASLDRHGLRDRLEAISGLTLCEPLGYLQFLGLVSASRFVVTDSGGIQEETTYLRIPCLTMRTSTERPVTCDIGSNELIGMDLPRLYAAVDEILRGRFKSGDIPPHWDGHAAERIVDVLASELPHG